MMTTWHKFAPPVLQFSHTTYRQLRGYASAQAVNDKSAALRLTCGIASEIAAGHNAARLHLSPPPSPPSSPPPSPQK